jgi:hypothetical protein
MLKNKLFLSGVSLALVAMLGAEPASAAPD